MTYPKLHTVKRQTTEDLSAIMPQAQTTGRPFPGHVTGANEEKYRK